MNKVLHFAKGMAKKAMTCAWKLSRKVAALVAETVCGAVAAVGKFFAGLAGKLAKWAGNKLTPLLPPLFLVTMIVSAVLAAASCAGWLLTKNKV